MQESEIFIKLLLSVVFGALLGLESETREIENKGEELTEQEERQRLGGFRTYTLISLFGGIAGIFYVLQSTIISYILFISLILLVFTAYYLNVKLKKAFGLTTEIAIIITFSLGFLTTTGFVRFEILLGILALMAFFLSQKRGIGQFIHKIQHKELIDIIKFSLVSLILLPILPNQNFYLSDVVNALNLKPLQSEALSEVYIINPFSIWLIVVLISGINLLAYYLSRMFGTKSGILLSGLFGGLFSSTSALISFASKAHLSKDQTLIKRYAGGAILANGVSFILAGILFLVSNVNLFLYVLPILLMMLVTSAIYGIHLINIKTSLEDKDIDHQIIYEPFSLIPALKFVTIIIAITIAIQLMQLLKIDDTLIVISTAISGITGIDAPIIAISNLNNSGNITIITAVFAFMFANIINLFAKAGYSKLLGNKIFFKYSSIGLMLSAVAGIIGFILILL